MFNPNLKHNSFARKNKLSCYRWWFIAADWYVTVRKRWSKFLWMMLSKKDIGHIEKLNTYLNGLPNNELLSNWFPCVYNSRYSTKIVEDLNRIYNITERKSLTLRPPNLEREKDILCYIAGYIDWDGSIHLWRSKQKNWNHICGIKVVGTYDVVLWIKDKINAIIWTKWWSISKRENIYILSIPSLTTIKLYKKLKSLKLPRLERKRSKVKWIIDNPNTFKRVWENVWSSKLSITDVNTIRKRYLEWDRVTHIAKDYPVSYQMISYIVKGKNRK